MPVTADEIVKIRAEKLVGIVIHDKANLFSNGITQNAYFIYQCLENAGLRCQFLCHEPNPVKFGYKDLTVKQISLNPLEFDASEYHTIITVTRGMLESHYKMFKEHKVRVVSFICGNSLMQHMEDFVKGATNPGFSAGIGMKANADELWIIPSLEYSVEYFKITKNISHAIIVPHLWSNQFLADVCTKFDKKPESALFYNSYSHTKRKLTVIIMEPNIGLVKNAWIPIIACEKINKMFPDLIENVFVFNYPKHSISHTMTDHLSLGKKLRKFERLSMSEIMLHFNKNESLTVFLSNQILTSLNYLYYEALYYGWPLVHNSTELDGCGYFYPEQDITKCAEAIMGAYNTHNLFPKSYIEKAHAFLDRCDPLNRDIKETFSQLIDYNISTALT